MAADQTRETLADPALDDVTWDFDDALPRLLGQTLGADPDRQAQNLINVLERYRPIVVGGHLGQCRHHGGEESDGEPTVLILTQPDDTSTDEMLGIKVPQKTVTLADLVEQVLCHESEERA